MKKLLVAALFSVASFTSAFAADTKINSSVMSSFKGAFKNASEVTWTTGGNYAKASFIINKEKMEAFYSLDGEMIGTSKAITLDQLSVKAKRSFSKRFEGYNVNEAIRFDGVEDGAYYISAQNENESVIVKVDDTDHVSVMKTSKK